MSLIVVTLLIQKCCASNVEFIPSPTRHADVDTVVRRIRKLADAGLTPFATSVERFRNPTCDVYAVRVITVIGIMKLAQWRVCGFVCNAAICQCRIAVATV